MKNYLDSLINPMSQTTTDYDFIMEKLMSQGRVDREFLLRRLRYIWTSAQFYDCGPGCRSFQKYNADFCGRRNAAALLWGIDPGLVLDNKAEMLYNKDNFVKEQT